MGEMLFQDDDKVVQVAMQIVIAAGDARNAAGKALDCVGPVSYTHLLGKGDFGVVFAESYWKKVGLM